MSKRNAHELCRELSKLAKLHAAPTELLRLCAEFTEVPPFQNIEVHALDMTCSRLGVSVDGLSGEYIVSANDEIHVLSPLENGCANGR